MTENLQKDVEDIIIWLCIVRHPSLRRIHIHSLQLIDPKWWVTSSSPSITIFQVPIFLGARLWCAWNLLEREQKINSPQLHHLHASYDTFEERLCTLRGPRSRLMSGWPNQGLVMLGLALYGEGSTDCCIGSRWHVLSPRIDCILRGWYPRIRLSKLGLDIIFEMVLLTISYRPL